ncbi:TIGR03085 family metal-binding protein [Aestuariimicrobium soli]|uniref:TIGR03085 family metal-binding protein n=1 Tax=Aestuariimicrobium soli TaxID=2035834 RepID=UPI003EBE223A
MTIASDERSVICDLFAELGPDRPTLCEGWTTGDLAAHLVVRENDPVAAGGIMIKPLAGHTERRMTEVLAAEPWAAVVERLRRGPGQWSLFRVPGVDEGANAIEFLVHVEDVRRAQTPPMPPRDLGPEVEDFCWRRLKLLAKALFRRLDAGLVLERTDGQGRVEESFRVRPGSHTVTVQGRPSELLLLAYGRGSHADVTVIADEAGERALSAAQFTAEQPV